METISDILDKYTGPTKEEILSDLASLEKLISILGKPEFREYVRFAVAWKDLDRALTKLHVKIQERTAETPFDRVNELLKKLVKKN